MLRATFFFDTSSSLESSQLQSISRPCYRLAITVLILSWVLFLSCKSFNFFQPTKKFLSRSWWLNCQKITSLTSLTVLDIYNDNCIHSSWKIIHKMHNHILLDKVISTTQAHWWFKYLICFNTLKICLWFFIQNEHGDSCPWVKCHCNLHNPFNVNRFCLIFGHLAYHQITIFPLLCITITLLTPRFDFIWLHLTQTYID